MGVKELLGRWTGRTATAPTTGYHWQPARGGRIPDGARPHGHDLDGSPLWVCRVQAFNGVHPAKVRPGLGGAAVAWAGVEALFDEYEVLMETGTWVRAQYGAVPDGSYPAGREADGEILYVARASAEYDDLTPGKVRPAFGAANIGFGNQELKVSRYEVLVGI